MKRSRSDTRSVQETSEVWLSKKRREKVEVPSGRTSLKFCRPRLEGTASRTPLWTLTQNSQPPPQLFQNTRQSSLLSFLSPMQSGDHEKPVLHAPPESLHESRPKNEPPESADSTDENFCSSVEQTSTLHQNPSPAAAGLKDGSVPFESSCGGPSELLGGVELLEAPDRSSENPKRQVMSKDVMKENELNTGDSNQSNTPPFDYSQHTENKEDGIETKDNSRTIKCSRHFCLDSVTPEKSFSSVKSPTSHVERRGGNRGRQIDSPASAGEATPSSLPVLSSAPAVPNISLSVLDDSPTYDTDNAVAVDASDPTLEFSQMSSEDFSQFHRCGSRNSAPSYDHDLPETILFTCTDGDSHDDDHVSRVPVRRANVHLEEIDDYEDELMLTPDFADSQIDL